MRILSVTALAIAGLLLASCATSTAAATATDKPAAAPAAAADKPADAPAAASGPVVLSTFEEEDATGVSSYKGGASSVETAVSEEVFHSGKASLEITTTTTDYMGVVIRPDESLMDFSAANELVFWLKGTASGAKINVVLEDAGKEQLSATIEDTSADWVEVVLPIKKFKSRTDYQASDAKVNKRPDYPLMSIHVFTVNNFTGKAYIDDVSVR